MFFISRFKSAMLVLAAPILAILFILSSSIFASATGPLLQLSSDPFTNSTSQHATEVEPDTFAAGSTIVSAFQVGRFFDGGASDIGFATSTNGGSSFKNGFLPATTTNSTPPVPMRAPVTPQWLSTQSTMSGSSHTWGLSNQLVLSMWMSAVLPMGD